MIAGGAPLLVIIGHSFGGMIVYGVGAIPDRSCFASGK
jgi:hypothetical protein